MRVLLLVDIQNDFCPGGSLPVPEGDQVVPVANKLMSSGYFDLSIATKDWHPSDHVSFETLWPRHCVQGTAGAELHPDLVQSGIRYIVEKGTRQSVDSYSGFYDNERRAETPLRELLEREARARGETLQDIRLTVCGLALDVCVEATARDAVSLGIPTELAVDGCRAVNLQPGDDVRILRKLASLGVELKTSGELVPEAPRPRPRSCELHP